MELKGNMLDDLSAVIGFTATVRLAAWYGDSAALVIPIKPDKRHTVCKVIGVHLTKKLSAEWGGKTIAIPRLANYERDLNNRLIMRMLEQGFECREISRAIRMSKDRVMQIMHELEEAGLLKTGKVKSTEKLLENSQENAIEN